MASTYSNLKIQLMTTGENTGAWGNVTNVNLGTALEEAITGSVDVTFASGDVTLTLTNTNATQSARNLRLNCTGTTGGARNLVLGSGCQIEKVYIVNNGCADAITIKNTTGNGIAVPAGKTMYVFNNGTNVVDAITHLTSLTLASALPVASGGTGATTLNGLAFNGENITSLNASNISSGTIANARTTAASANGASTIVARDASGNFSANTITANLTGTASSATTATQVANNLTLATSGTGLSGSATFNGSSAQSFTVTSNASSANGASTLVARDASGNFSANVITANGSSLTSLNASNVSTGTLDNARTTASSSNGASTIVTRDASGNFSANTITASLTGTASNASSLTTASGAAPSYSARVWVNFDGTGTNGTNQTIRGSGNVSSVYKNGTGDYTINFTTALSDANYAAVFGVKSAIGSGTTQVEIPTSGGDPTSSALRINTMYVSSTNNRTLIDASIVSVSIFR